MLLCRAAIASWLLASTVQSIDLVVEDEASVKEAASTVAYGLVGFYYGNLTGDVPGNLPDPYYWWLCGAMFGTLIDYWHYTGDDTYNEITMQAMLHQVGDERDFMPDNQTRSMGNDDQGFWAMTSMTAAENLFPDPPNDDDPQWLALVQGVFNDFTHRWSTRWCEGGLHWQVYTVSESYMYKNSVSNGCFFNIAARLARYTGNDSYVEWAERVWDWEVDLGLITGNFSVLDGAGVKDGEPCEDHIDITEWTYNAGIFIHGSAVLWDYTGEQKWRDRVDGLLDHSLDKFTWEAKREVLYEQRCEPWGDCDDDQRSFKGYYLRGLAATIHLIPELYDTLMPTIRSSAEAAAAVCVGNPTEPVVNHPPWRGHPNTACGLKWTTNGTFDGSFGVGEQMSALSVLIYTLVNTTDIPRTNETGGTSIGDPGAGGGDDGARIRMFGPITTGDRVGAGFLTTLILAGIILGTWFVVMEPKTVEPKAAEPTVSSTVLEEDKSVNK